MLDGASDGLLAKFMICYYRVMAIYVVSIKALMTHFHEFHIDVKQNSLQWKPTQLFFCKSHDLP
jgi:hypothetical protein